ncbi:MAG: type VI secretion system membrane subunit TssM [Granulosicoccus sp.]
MASLVKLLKNRLFIAFIGILFLSLFIWFAGPLLGFNGQAPLESSRSRVIAIVSLSFIWAFSAIIRFMRSRKKNKQMLDSLLDDALSPSDEESSEELEILKEKMEDAVNTLKRLNLSKSGGNRFVYEMPWYTIIGPPGAGKTTLLSNSGLEFPLEEKHGKLSIKGVGGTRNCDWWFTDQAVLLDTAGRYTTQDSNTSVDKHAWDNFLELLKTTRGRRPINGVLIALSIQDIVQSDEDTLKQTAKLIRSRIDELYSKLCVTPPVYLLITKCDLLAGFNEYFSDLDKDGRQQVWGFTLPLDCDNSQLATSTQLDALEHTTKLQSIDKLHRELSRKNREMIYSFPMQFSAIQSKTRNFISYLTVQSRLQENVLFRGAYFTSATQSGSVLDQVIETVSRSFGINEFSSSNQASTGKSFFINKLLRDVVFKESGLVGTNMKTERRHGKLQLLAGSVIGLLLLSTIGFWTGSFLKNKTALHRIEEDAIVLRNGLLELPSDKLDLFDVNKILNDANALTFASGSAQSGESGFISKHAGLYQGNNVDELANRKYDDLLIDILLPRLMVRLEQQMHAESDNSEFLFEALKTYQMIDNRDHFESDSIVGWFNFDIDSNLPSDTTSSIRNSLKKHINRLFREQPYRMPRPLDSKLITQFQTMAAEVSIDQRAYNRIRKVTKGSQNSYFRLTTNAGPAVPITFSRIDDVSLDQSIPDFFTLDGFHKVFLPASKNISSTLALDNWVLGDAVLAATHTLTQDELQNSVKQKYYAEYIDTWITLIDSIRLKPVDGLQNASEFISLITDLDSPLKQLLILISEQTRLTRPQQFELEDKNQPEATSRETELGEILKDKSATTEEIGEIEIDSVTSKFESLHQLTASWETNESRLDQILLQLSEINQQLLPMSQSPTGTINPQLNSDLAITMQKLTTKSSRLPDPLATLISGLTNEISDVVGGGFCQQLNTAWKTDVYSFYKRAISNRYPVNRSGTSDIALVDFGVFFGQGGVVDKFTNTYLSSLVSRTPGQWTWIGTGSSVCLSDNTLKQLAFADDIKNTFFSQSGQNPSFRFDVVPESLNMSADLDQLFLNIGGKQLEYFHGPINGTTSFNWPGDNTQVSLRVEPTIPGSSSSISMSGPWAILHLLDQGSRDAKRGMLTVNYNFSGRSFSITMVTSSFNPLNSVALRNFRAPENL